MTPREFQSRAMSAVGHQLRSVERGGCGKQAVVLVSPTGSGKTFSGMLMCLRWIEHGIRQPDGSRRPAKIAWGAHRGELLDQARETAWKVGITSGITFGTYQTWSRRCDAPDADIFIADECHHLGQVQAWRMISKGYRDAGKKLVGLTATPGRADGGALPDFDAIVVAAQIAELQALGLLVRLWWRGPSATLAAGKIAWEPVEAYQREAPGRCAIVFAQNTRAGADYLADFAAANIRAELVTGAMPASERAAAIARHRSGETLVLINCGVLTEGFDNPRVDCVIVARNCGSEALWVQMAGRGLRTCGKCETCEARNRGLDERTPCLTKPDCKFLDLHGVAHDLGRPDAPATYSLDGKGITLADPAMQLERLCKVCQTPLGDSLVCAECGKDHTPPKPKAIDAPLTDWQAGWNATRDALKASRPVMCLAGILRQEAEAKLRGKPWKPGAAAFRFSKIMKRYPYAQEMVSAMNFVKAAGSFVGETA